MRHVACLTNSGYQGLQYAVASGFMGQGIGMNYGMGFQTPFFPSQQLPPPVSPLMVPSMLTPGLCSISSHLVPGESSSHKTALAGFLNPYPGISQGSWEPSTSVMPRRQVSRSMTSNDVTTRLVEKATSLSSGLSRLKVGTMSSSLAELGSRVQSVGPLPHLFGYSQSFPAKTSAIGFSTSIHPIQEESGSQIPTIATIPDHMPDSHILQDQLSTTHQEIGMP